MDAKVHTEDRGQPIKLEGAHCHNGKFAGFESPYLLQEREET